jgi:hypothetical protein
MIDIAGIIIYGSAGWTQIKGPLIFLVDHLRDPSPTISHAIEAPVRIPFVPTVRVAELRWWNGYFNTYHTFDNLILLGGHYQNSFNQRAIRTVSWQMGNGAQDIYATALTILQVG